MGDVDQGPATAPDEGAYIRALDAAVGAPGSEIARVTCRHCNGRRVIGTVHLSDTALLWVSHGWVPAPVRAGGDDVQPVRTTNLSQVLLSVSVDERPEQIRHPEGYCVRHGRITVDETQIPKQRPAGRWAPHIPM